MDMNIESQRADLVHSCLNLGAQSEILSRKTITV